MANYTPLFDPASTTNPHPTLMQLLIRTFFGYLGTNNAFISYNEVVQRFSSGQLSPVLANAIAAAAVPYADGLQQATGHDSIAIVQAYSANAKVCSQDCSSSIRPLTYAQAILEKRRNDSSLSTLYAAILIAWSEITNDSYFQYYASVCLNPSDIPEQSCLTADFAARS
jgi:hypothetical protein